MLHHAPNKKRSTTSTTFTSPTSGSCITMVMNYVNGQCYAWSYKAEEVSVMHSIEASAAMSAESRLEQFVFDIARLVRVVLRG